MNPCKFKSLAIAARPPSSRVGCGAGGGYSGAGATFPYPSMRSGRTPTRRRPAWVSTTSHRSGGGIKQIKAKTVTFGASDMRSNLRI